MEAPFQNLFTIHFSKKAFMQEMPKRKLLEKHSSLSKMEWSILTGGGTTMIELARMVPSDLRCTLFTVSPLLALELIESSNIDVHLIGGQLSKNAQNQYRFASNQPIIRH
ncbi:hypothetical protein [Pedobacter sp. UC225_65]|uniref:hypothetical protein n=1 Tax=Pedobacter sp. UC225_65 TaxID=3350173 RepID=UPI00366EACE1